MFKRVLIANRGEIARRIARTCARLGVGFVTVHSDADAASSIEGAEERVRIGPGPAAQSYLDIDAVLDAARATGCDAVHPGYGFLSENPAFAEAVNAAGLAFIGPSAKILAAVGDKAEARRLMAAAGVPVLPGSPAATEALGDLARDAAAIGYPVILKPVAGGGGKGMAVVENAADLASAAESAIRIARSAFGDGRLIAERYVRRPRHIEVQVFGDQAGNVVHLFERECSLQRRHQKIVEEAPAAGLAPAVRESLLDAAVRGAAALGYTGAGTFEFALDGEEFYFLEVNARLQVEHPVTEAVTGLDLVEWQLRVASGEPLPLRQEQVAATGHAVEARVYAEDPDAGFRPAPGRAAHLRWPAGVRVDAAFDGPGEIPPFYDPMVAKVIAHGPDRAAALGRLRTALRTTVVLGLTTNLGFLADLVASPEVEAGQVDTHLVDHLAAEPAPVDPAPGAACAAALTLPADAVSPWLGAVGPFDRAGLDADAPLGGLTVRHEGRELRAQIRSRDGGRVSVAVDGRPFRVGLAAGPGSRASWRHGTVDGLPWAGVAIGDGFELIVGGRRVALERWSPEAAAGESSDGLVRAPMPGTVVRLAASPGERVEEGDVLAVVEAMKMEHPVAAPFTSVVTSVDCELGQVVSAGQILAVLEPEA